VDVSHDGNYPCARRVVRNVGAIRGRGHPVFRLLFAGYVVVEVAALWAVAATIGVGWAILLVMLGSALGVIAFGTQSRRLLESLAGRTGSARGSARSVGHSLAAGSRWGTGEALLFMRRG